MPRVYRRKPLVERFEAFVDRTSTPDGCHEWLGNRHLKNGYGRISAGGRAGRILDAHRVALELALGRPIRDGFQANHACNNPPCCRVGPGHIYEGTQAQNLHDALVRGTKAPPPHGAGSKNNNAKLSVQQVLEIRAATASSHAALARLYGVSAQNIRDVRLGRTWRTAASGWTSSDSSAP